MHTVRIGPVIGLIAELATLGALTWTVGLSAAGWLAGIGCSLVTTAVLMRGLAAAGEDNHEPYIQRGNEWLRSIQNADGGWGESCASYDNGIYTPAHSTPSQSAWALMGLIAGGDTYSSSVRNGIRYLLETQRPDGNWDEDLSTGTGFPKVFYLTYHNYRISFPLMALAAFAKTSDTERA